MSKKATMQRIRENENAVRLVRYEDSVRRAALRRDEQVAKAMQESARDHEEFALREDNRDQMMSDASSIIAANKRTEAPSVNELLADSPSPTAPTDPSPVPPTVPTAPTSPTPSSGLYPQALLEERERIAQAYNQLHNEHNQLMQEKERIVQALNQLTNEHNQTKQNYLKDSDNLWERECLLKVIFSIMQQGPANLSGFVINRLEKEEEEIKSNPLMNIFLSELKAMQAHKKNTGDHDKTE